MKNLISNRIVEINVYRSNRNRRLGHAVASLFPCGHHRYLGMTLYKGGVDSKKYITQECLILKFDAFEVRDKAVCKLCPDESDFYLDISSDTTLDDFVSALEAVDSDVD